AVFQGSATATEFGAQGRQIAEQIITSLVSAQGTRQPRVREALQAETGHPEEARAVVDYLVGERLLTIRSDQEDITKSLVDLSHEALIANWDRLRGWLAEDPQGRAMREEFRTAAEKWEAGVAGVPPRSRHGLPGSDVARNYLAWIAASNPRLSPVQQEFAAEMRAMLTRQRTRRRVVMASLAALAVASSALAVYADGQAGRARTSAKAALKSEGEAKQSEAKAVAEKRAADIQAATLALEKGIEACEQGRPRLGILAIAHSLDICPPDATDLRRVILTNLAGWGPYLMCLDDVRVMPHPILATDPAGKYALLVLPPLRPDLPIYQLQLFDIDAGKPAGPPITTQWYAGDGTPELGYQVARAVVFPKGEALLSGSGFSSVWDMKTGKQIGARIEHGTLVAAVSLEAKLVAATNPRDDIVFYELGTGKTRSAGHSHQGKVYDLCFSPDGKLLASGCGRRADRKADEKDEGRDPDGRRPEGFVHLYDVTAGAVTLRPGWRRPMRSAVTCVKICPENKIVTGGGFELRSWKIDKPGTPEDGKILDTRYSPESTVHIAFDPKDTSEYIACNPSGGLQILRRDEAIRLSGERLSPQGRVAGTGFRENGQVFTANGDGTVRIWNRPLHGGDSHAADREFKPPKAEAVLSVAFRPDGNAFALGSKTGIVYLYELGNATPKPFLCTDDPKTGARRPVTDLRFSTDGTRIIAHDEDLDTFVFDTRGKADPLPVPGKLIGVAADGRTGVVHTHKGGPPRKGTHGSVGSGNTVVIQAHPEEYQIVEVGSGALPNAPKMVVPGGVAEFGEDAGDGHLLRVSRVAFAPDRSVVALLDWAGSVHLFRTATSERVCAPLRHGDGEANNIWAVVFCPAGDTLLTRSPKGRATWDARTGAPAHLLTNRVGVQVTRFSPSGKLVLGATNFNMAQVWDTSGREVVPVPLVHAAQVWAVAANPDETRIVTASFDRTARIWDRVTGRSISPPIRHRQGVSDATFSPDGRFALTGSWDGTARLWKVAEPLPDKPDQVRAWVQTLTGLKIGLSVSGELMTADEWVRSKQELDRLGGPPPGTVPEPPEPPAK
ncbi:MAG TPA: hypothetical protein VMZ71_12340, partial [Gemmataceae bacterium]|nr:hypothetical protein [Gemmataceae bacterium]